MSADQRAWLATGVARRLLLRAVLVLGGAFAVTLAGWLLSATSAHADVLPSVPNVPSVLSSASSDVTAVPRTELDGLSADITAIDRHAHNTVTGAGKGISPSVVPAADVLPRGDLVPLTAKVDPAERQQPKRQGAVTKMAAYPSAHLTARVSPTPSRSQQSFTTVAQRRHMSDDAALGYPTGSTPSPVDAGHHSPALPPLQPASSSDSSVHSGGSVAGGSGGMQFTFAHPLGTGFVMAGPSNTPRLSAGPGCQPGTSPD